MFAVSVNVLGNGYQLIYERETDANHIYQSLVEQFESKKKLIEASDDFEFSISVPRKHVIGILTWSFENDIHKRNAISDFNEKVVKDRQVGFK